MRTPNKSRSRNKNNRRNNNSGGNALNRVYDSAGPDGRVRGTPQQVIEKYQSLAHDSSLSGDRVAMENFQQHAEHYIRLTNEAQRQINERREAMEQQNQNQNQSNNNQQQRRNNNNNNNDNSAAVVDANDPGAGDQPPVVAPDVPKDVPLATVEEAAPAGDDGGLVETPETKAAAKRKPASRPRRQKPAPTANDDAKDAKETATEVPPAAE